MKLQNTGLQSILEINEDYAYTMEIRPLRLFARTVQSFCSLEKGEDPVEPFSLLNEKGEMDAAKLLYVLSDPFHMELNSRKLLNTLYAAINAALQEDVEKLAAWQRLMQQSADLIKEICRSFHSDTIQTGNFSCVDFCRLIGVQFDQPPEESVVNSIFWLMGIVAEWAPEKLLVVCNVTPFLSPADRRELLKYACYTKVHMLTIDQSLPAMLEPCEIRWLITEDFDDVIIYPQ